MSPRYMNAGSLSPREPSVRSNYSMGQTVVVSRNRHQGVLAGLLGCVFGVLGIFTWGLIFVPLAAICSLVGLLRGIAGFSISGIGCSLLAAVLTVWGFVVSPSLRLLLGAGILASHQTAIQRPPAPSAAIETPRSAPPSLNNDLRDIQIVTQVQAIIPAIQRFDGVADAFLDKLPPIEDRYRAITARMNQYLARKEQLAGISNPSVGVIRSQISVALSQASIATDQIYYQTQPARWNFQNNVVPLRQKAVLLEHMCDGLSSVEAASACDQLADLDETFKKEFDAVSDGLTRLEQTYQTERNMQQQIIDGSSRIP